MGAYIFVSISTKCSLYRIDGHYRDLQFRKNVFECVFAAHQESPRSLQGKIMKVALPRGCARFEVLSDINDY